MHPDEKRPNKFQTGKSRARMFLKKNAGWLPGYPLESGSGTIRWQAWPWESPGTPHLVTLDRDALRRLETVLNKLRHRFPNALPRIVEDVEDWLARMDYLLELLKGAIHRDRPIDASSLLDAPCASARWIDTFRRRRARHPSLACLLDAIAFLEFTGRRRCDTAALDWVEEHAAVLSQMTSGSDHLYDLALTVCTLRDDLDADLLRPLLEALAEPSVRSAPSSDIGKHAEELAAEFQKALADEAYCVPERTQQPTIAEDWRHFLLHQLRLTSKSRRLSTTLLGRLVSVDVTSVLRRDRRKIEEEESRIRRLLRLARNGRLAKPFKVERTTLSGIPAMENPFRRLQENSHFALIHIAAIAEDVPHLRQWIAFTDCLPDDDRSLRLGLFAAWETARLRLVRMASADRGLRQALAQLCRLFSRRGVHPALLRHWHAYIASTDRHAEDAVISLLDAGYHERNVYRNWARLLEAAVYDHGSSLGPKLSSSLGEFVEATADVGLAARLIAALAAREDAYYSRTEIQAVLAVANEDSNFVPLMQTLENDCELVDAAIAIGKHIRAPRLRRIVERWMIAGAKKPLLRLASWINAAIGLGLSLPASSETQTAPGWATRYPIELHQALGNLQQAVPGAEAVAAGILRRDFPNPADLQRELDAIRRELATSAGAADQIRQQRLQTRLENLQRYISLPSTVTPARLANLARKINERADNESIEQFFHHCHAIVGDELRTTWGVGQSLDALLAPPRDQLLSGILRLRGRTRELGLQLLFASLGDAQPDFRNEPENAAFLERIRAKGVQLEPWLGTSFENTVKTANREPYRLFFARDVLDILLMGARFETCLSPGDVNFFSTIANAIDVNKQVVYGKTKSGRIVGRCLFALTDNGRILTYHRYAHEAADRFDQEVDRFAEQLARAMGTAVTSTGRVANLVAERWYDDGPVSSESIYDFRNPTGPVRTILQTAPASAIVDRLAEFFGSPEALRSELGPLLFLEEFQSRREIVTPLLHRFGFDPELPFPETYRLAMLGHVAGEDDEAMQLVRRMGISSLPRRLKHFACRHYGCPEFHGLGSCRQVIGLLIDCNPTIALRTLRLSRPEGVKSDEQETDPDRKKMLARCHRLLGRLPKTSAAVEP